MPVIKVKRGTTTPSSLVQGEVAYNTSANQMWIGNASNTPVKIIGSAGAMESNSVAITGGTMSGVTTTATSVNLTSLTLNAGERLYYDEGGNASAYTGNWNYTETYNMTDCAGLGNVTVHGWGGSARTYQLTLTGVPTHTEIKFECLIHQVDSWDAEQNVIYLQNSSGADVTMASWNKQYSTAPYNVATYNSTEHTWFGGRWYSYLPWGGNQSENSARFNGYSKVTTGWFGHTTSTIIAKMYTGLDQAQSDEAFYISHVKVWIRGGNSQVTGVTTSTSLSGNSNSTLPTEAAVKGYADQYNGTLKNLYSYTGNSTYTKSGSDVQRLRVICVGGGGGGRGYHESGGGGGYAERWIDATNISSVSITVGGGSGGGYYFGFSGQGGTTSFGSYVSASGGYGANQNKSHCGGHGGIGSGGQINTYGGGGGGHAPGYNNQQGGMSGEGGATFFGGGGAGRHGGNSFNPVAAPGGGGPGGAGNHNGSDGYAGICLVYEYR